MKIKLSQSEIEWCKKLAIKRSASMNHADTKNSQNFLDNKPWHRHFVGVIGEYAYSKITGYKVDNLTIGRGDDGTDFPNGVQVKSSDINKRPNLMFPIKQWERKKADMYVLMWVKLPIVEFVGAITRNNIIRYREKVNFGYGESYFIDNKYLND